MDNDKLEAIVDACMEFQDTYIKTIDSHGIFVAIQAIAMFIGSQVSQQDHPEKALKELVDMIALASEQEGWKNPPDAV